MDPEFPNRPAGALDPAEMLANVYRRGGRLKLRRRVATTGMGLLTAGAGVGLVLTVIPGSSPRQVVSTDRTPPSNASTAPASCPESPFVLKAPSAGLVSPTPDFTTAAYRHLAIGQTAVLFSDRAPGDKEIWLTRGVGNGAFAVSAWSHGPKPLTPVTVLGSTAMLYPAGEGEPGARIPFRYPSKGSQNDPCERYQLQAIGLDDHTLIQVAATAVPTTPSTPGDYGLLQRFVPETSTTWWAVIESNLNSNAYVVRTVDGGKTWQSAFQPTGPVAASTFLSADTAWVVPGDPATNPPIYRTTDGGTTWQKVGNDPGGCQLQFVDTLHGWCIDIGAAAGSETVDIHRTVDGGATWTEVSRTGAGPSSEGSTPNSLPFGCDKGINFTSDTVGWASSFCNGGSAYLYKTVDAGAHWYPLATIPLPPGTPQPAGAGLGQPAAQGNSLAVAETIGGSSSVVIATSADGGQSWKSQLIPGTTQPWTVDLIDPTHWRLANGTQLMATDDAGAHWRTSTVSASSKSSGSLGSIDTVNFLSPTDGWAVSSPEGTVWWTNDGGTTWTPIQIVAGPYRLP